MANISEKNEWQAIPQIEDGEVFDGGIDGNANKQAKALANRTAYLKKTIQTHTHTSADIGAAPKFSLATTGAGTVYTKIAELTTNIGSKANGIILYLNGTNNYGNNTPGVDVVQCSTRGSVNLKAYGLIPQGNENIRYGYVNNATTGKTEIWLKLVTYNTQCEIIVGQACNATYGNLLSQDIEPSNITYIDKQKIVTIGHFTQSFATNGWTKLPNGLIMQWGIGATTSEFGPITKTVKDISFPIVFPNKILNWTSSIYVCDTNYAENYVGTCSMRNVNNAKFDGQIIKTSVCGTLQQYYTATGY